MTTQHTQQLSPEAETAYAHLAEIMAQANKTITFNGLPKGTVSPEVAQEASDRVVRRATTAYKRLLEEVGPESAAKVLAEVLAELTVSTATTWVSTFHEAIFETFGNNDQ